MAAPFQLQRLGEPAHGELRGRVDGHLRYAIQPRCRAHVEHLRLRRRAQERKGRVTAVEDALQVDRQQPRVVLQGDLFEAAETQDAGAVE